MDGDIVLPRALAALGAVVVACVATHLRARRQPWKSVSSTLALLSSAALSAGVWARFVEPHWIETTHTRIEWPGPSLRVVVAGDFHAGRAGPWLIGRAVRAINAAHPDVVLLSGDYISGYALTPDRELALEPLRWLRPRLSTYAVLGNHDSEPYAEPTPRAEAIARFLEGARITVLRNAWREPTPGVTVIGLDEVQAGRTDAPLAFEGVSGRGQRIVLAHNWRALRAPGVGDFDFATASHSHGGQLCVPVVRWCPFARDSEPYVSGLYRWPARHDAALYMNRGIGESEVLARFACRPEVTVIDFVHRSR